MLRSTRRGLETWHGRDRVTLADERARQQGTQTSTYTGAPVLDPTCERAVVRFRRATRLLIFGERHLRRILACIRHITIRRARTWHCGRMRRYGELSAGC